jgi:hypothetical protein
MALIRIGRFDNFGGADTLLIEGDQAGFKSLIRAIHELQGSSQPVRLTDHPDVIIYGGFSCVLEVASEDRGLVVLSTESLSWRRSLDGWTDIVVKLLLLEGAVSPGHHYLDGPTDDLQVIASVGEYGQSWWNSHAG